MVWLTSQSVWLLVIGCLVIAAAVALGSRLLALRLLPPKDREEAHSIAAALMTAFAAAFALLTALSLANEVTSLSSAQTTVSTEAAAAAALAWSSTNPGVHTAPVQTALRNYLVATRTFEWHGAASANGDDPQTDNALAALERTVRGQAARPVLGTATSMELLTNVDALTNQRRIRLADASHSIPDFYVVLVVVVGLALIVNTSVVGIRGGVRASLVTISLSIVIALSIALLLSLATPWRGAIQVSGHPIDSVITDLNTNYFRS
ncbi:MAG TPA: hypothetical protein VNU75_07145 [Acidimicrobiales bacterium]|nr:hypothetical protein [Acidimicrobiales bacterium]